MLIYSELEHTEFTKPILNRIWSIFDIFRNDHITSEDYDIILFLLSAYKDGLLDNIISSPIEETKEIIARNLWNADDSLDKKEYLVIYSKFKYTVERLSSKSIYTVINLINALDAQILKLHFPYFFDAILYRIAQSQGRLGGEYLQPIELTRFIYNLADLHTNATVYNPFAGVASFGIFLDNNQSYLGQEINSRIWAIGSLRLLAYSKFATSKYINDDSIQYWPNESYKFDLIVSNPPFGIKLSNSYKGFASGLGNTERFFIEKGIESLSENGKLIAVLPSGFFSRGGGRTTFKEAFD